MVQYSLVSLARRFAATNDASKRESSRCFRGSNHHSLALPKFGVNQFSIRENFAQSGIFKNLNLLQ